MNIPDNFSESLETIFGVKNVLFFDADADPGSRNLFDPWFPDGKIRIRDTGSFENLNDVLYRIYSIVAGSPAEIMQTQSNGVVTVDQREIDRLLSVMLRCVIFGTV
jgi:hypothetical protein